MTYRFTDLKAACRDDWRAYSEHEFVTELGAGTLEPAAFRHLSLIHI